MLKYLSQGQICTLQHFAQRKATDHFTLDRDGRHVLEPKFTFHGFQFAEVTGPAKFISAVGVAISSANERRGFIYFI